jgi:hypothetical protein
MVCHRAGDPTAKDTGDDNKAWWMDMPVDRLKQIRALAEEWGVTLTEALERVLTRGLQVREEAKNTI